MFAATFADPAPWVAIVNAVGAVLDEGTILVTEKGIFISGYDLSRVCYLHLKLSDALFTKYSCVEDTRLAVQFGDMVKVLKRLSADDRLSVRHKKDSNSLVFIMARGKRKRAFRLSLGIPASEEETKSPVEALVDAYDLVPLDFAPAILVEAIKDAEIFAQDLDFLISENVLTLYAQGDTGELEYEIPIEYEGEDVSSGYMLSYLKKIMQIHAVASSMAFETGDQIPALVSFDLEATDGTEIGSLLYVLAPRVKEDPIEDAYADEFDEDWSNFDEEDFSEFDETEE